MPKEKLTLSVDKEVVDKAKKLGINISDITEKVLTGYTAAEKPNDDIYGAYVQLFDSIIPLLKEFDCSVKVAEGTEVGTSKDAEGNTSECDLEVTFFLCSDGQFYVDEFAGSFKDIKTISQSFFLSPDKILSNLVEALANSKEKRGEQIKEIQMAKRIIEAMSETLLKKTSTKQLDKNS
jgi:hypothetical protein